MAHPTGTPSPDDPLPKDLDPTTTLRVNFRDGLGLSEDATDWLLGLWRLIQTFDDIVDGEDVPTDDLYQMVYDALAGLPSNDFYLRHQAWLVPAMAQAAMKWMASDRAERAHMADARSYMWRAGFYDVVMLAVSLEHGPMSENTWAALSLYGETLAEYLKEYGGGLDA